MVNEPCHASGDNKKSDTFYSPFSRYKGERYKVLDFIATKALWSGCLNRRFRGLINTFIAHYSGLQKREKTDIALKLVLSFLLQMFFLKNISKRCTKLQQALYIHTYLRLSLTFWSLCVLSWLTISLASSSTLYLLCR